VRNAHRVPTFVGASRERIRPGEPLPRRLATGDLLTNCKICEKVRLGIVQIVIISRWEKELSKEELNKDLSQSKSMAEFEVQEPAASTGGGSLH